MTDKDITEKLAAHHGEWLRAEFGSDIVVATSIPEQALAEILRLRAVIERDRSDVAGALTHMKAAIAGRAHLRGPGRGSFEWDDEKYQAEFGSALDDIGDGLKILSKISRDWTDSPKDPVAISKARATKVPLLEKAADMLKTITGHDSYQNLSAKYGDQWWTPMNIVEQNLRIASKDLAVTGGLDVPSPEEEKKP